MKQSEEGKTGTRTSAEASSANGGKELRDSDRPSVAKVTDSVAERVEDLGGYLSNRGPEQLVKDIKGLATREPLVFAGACFALGMFAARVVKAATHGSVEPDAGASSASRSSEGASTGTSHAGGRASSPASAGTSPSRSRSGTSRASS